MSLVGPRPLPAPLYAEYQRAIPNYNLRHAVKPGITGFAQLWQGYTNTLEGEALKWKYDLYYIQRMSFKEDLSIIWKTVVGGSARVCSKREAMRRTVIANAVACGERELV